MAVILIAAVLSHLNGAALPTFTADPNTRRIFTIVAKGRGATGADPAIAPIVTLLLLFEPLGKQLPQGFQVELGQHGELLRSQSLQGFGILQPI